MSFNGLFQKVLDMMNLLNPNVLMIVGRKADMDARAQFAPK